MDRIIFGDNQFFGVNHLSEKKASIQKNKFRDINQIIKILDYVQDIGINTFMCTTYDRIGELCNYIRADPEKYKSFQLYPCMPYAHKYANAVTEHGILGTMKEYIGGKIFSSITKGTMALAKKDFISLMQLLVDIEMSMFKGITTGVIFLQNVVTDLILGLKMYDLLLEYGLYIKEKYNAEPGYITMNLPLLIDVLEAEGVVNPIICSSINKINFRMSGGIELYEKTLSERKFRPFAMQVLAAGALSPFDAFEYVCKLPNVESILFGASTESHILQSKELIEQFSN